VLFSCSVLEPCSEQHWAQPVAAVWPAQAWNVLTEGKKRLPLQLSLGPIRKVARGEGDDNLNTYRTGPYWGYGRKLGSNHPQGFYRNTRNTDATFKVRHARTSVEGTQPGSGATDMVLACLPGRLYVKIQLALCETRLRCRDEAQILAQCCFFIFGIQVGKSHSCAL
jgi:hypothetical protein